MTVKITLLSRLHQHWHHNKYTIHKKNRYAIETPCILLMRHIFGHKLKATPQLFTLLAYKRTIGGATFSRNLVSPLFALCRLTINRFNWQRDEWLFRTIVLTQGGCIPPARLHQHMLRVLHMGWVWQDTNDLLNHPLLKRLVGEVCRRTSHFTDHLYQTKNTSTLRTGGQLQKNRPSWTLI